MNPRRIEIHVKGHTKKVENDFEIANIIAHLQGVYVRDALIATVGNMFSSKNSKPYEYPEKPYSFDKENNELSEEEIQRQRDLFVANYMAMMANFQLSHKKGQAEESE